MFDTSNELERRRTPRHPFGGVAEFAVAQSGEYFVGITAELGRHGCFIKTKAVLPPGTRIDLRITHEGREFCTLGMVAYSVPDRGLGISFGPSASATQTILSEWLQQSST